MMAAGVVMPPNAWFYYVFPLLLGVVFVCGGFTLFRRAARGERDARGNKYGAGAGCGGVIIMLIGAAVALGIVVTSPPPWTRQRLFNHVFHTPPDQIDRFVIRAPRGNDYRPLNRKEITIDDPAVVRRIAQSLADAREIWPNHPRTRWHAEVMMFTCDGGSYLFGVSATEAGDTNSTMVSPCATLDGGGWNLGDARADGLDKLLEDAVNAAEHLH